MYQSDHDKAKLKAMNQMAENLSKQIPFFDRKPAIRKAEEVAGLVELACLLEEYRAQLLKTLIQVYEKNKLPSQNLIKDTFSTATFARAQLHENAEASHYQQKMFALLKLLETINLGSFSPPNDRLESFKTLWETALKDKLLEEYHYYIRPSWLLNSFTAIAPSTVGNMVKSHEQVLVENIENFLAKANSVAAQL